MNYAWGLANRASAATQVAFVVTRRSTCSDKPAGRLDSMGNVKEFIIRVFTGDFTFHLFFMLQISYWV